MTIDLAVPKGKRGRCLADHGPYLADDSLLVCTVIRERSQTYRPFLHIFCVTHGSTFQVQVQVRGLFSRPQIRQHSNSGIRLLARHADYTSK